MKDPFKLNFLKYTCNKEDNYSIIIEYIDGHKEEIHNITNPWPYIKTVKKNINIKNAYIKNN